MASEGPKYALTEEGLSRKMARNVQEESLLAMLDSNMPLQGGSYFFRRPTIYGPGAPSSP
jgi:hypothetical protein